MFGLDTLMKHSYIDNFQVNGRAFLTFLIELMVQKVP